MKVVFTKATGFVAWVIRKITGSEASHVGVELDDGTFLQADQGGVQVSSKDDFLLHGERTVIATFEPGPDIIPRIDLAWGKSKIGSGYDYFGLVGDLIPMLSWRWFHTKVGDPLNVASRYWCSEFVVALDQTKSIPEFEQFNPRTVSPGQLLEAMNSGSSFVKVDFLKIDGNSI